MQRLSLCNHQDSGNLQTPLLSCKLEVSDESHDLLTSSVCQRYITVGAVCHTFAAATIHLMDAVYSNPAMREQALKKLSICTSALQEMGQTWSWSSRAYRAIKLLSNVWLTSIDSTYALAGDEVVARQVLPEVVSSKLDQGPGFFPFGSYGLPATDFDLGFSTLNPQDGLFPSLQDENLSWLYNNSGLLDADIWQSMRALDS